MFGLSVFADVPARGNNSDTAAVIANTCLLVFKFIPIPFPPALPVILQLTHPYACGPMIFEDAARSMGGSNRRLPLQNNENEMKRRPTHLPLQTNGDRRLPQKTMLSMAG
jgi:hypothetical protein